MWKEILNLKELRNYKRKFFCVCYKTRRQHNQHFKTAVFHNKFAFRHIKIHHISTYRKLNLPITGSIYFVFLPIETQKRLKQTKVCHAFSYYVRRETNRKPLKVAAVKSLFSSVTLLVQLVSMNVFILYDNQKTLLFVKVYRYSETFLSANLLLSLRPVFWKKSAFYALSPQ